MRAGCKCGEERFSRHVIILHLFSASTVVSKKQAENALGTALIVSEKAVAVVLKDVADKVKGIGWTFYFRDGENTLELRNISQASTRQSSRHRKRNGT